MIIERSQIKSVDPTDLLESTAIKITKNIEDSNEDVQLFDIVFDLSDHTQHVELFSKMVQLNKAT